MTGNSGGLLHRFFGGYRMQISMKNWQKSCGWKGDSLVWATGSLSKTLRKFFSCIVEQAYQHDLSQMRFWGNVDVELCKNGLARTAEGQKHLFNLAHKLLKRPKSLPISVVIRIYEEMVSRADRFGECVALLAMLLLGLRTSEAAGLSYGDIRQMDEELYAIERRYVEKQSSRDV